MTAGRRYSFFVLGAFRFPHGDASAQRLLTLAQTAVAGGRDTLVVNDSAVGAPPGYVPGTVGTVDGVDFVCLPSPQGGPARRLIHRASRPLRLGRVVARHRDPGARTAVSVASGLCSLGLLFTLRVLLRTLVVADVVERHDAGQFDRGWLAPYFLRHRWTSFLSGCLADGVIVISSHLARTYHGHQANPLVLPPLVDLNDYPEAAPPGGDALELLYLGNPRGKDKLGIVFDAITGLPSEERDRVRLTIAGADEAALAANPDVGPSRVDAMGARLTALGYLDRPSVLDLLSRSDFSVLVRPTSGYAAAGFPSKVPESLAAGCPVLCNLTTDLGDYLVDGENALVCLPPGGTCEVTVETVGKALSRAVALSPAEKSQMKDSARRSAEAFSTNAWAPALNAWLQGVA